MWNPRAMLFSYAVLGPRWNVGFGSLAILMVGYVSIFSELNPWVLTIVLTLILTKKASCESQ